jgi:inhibitor of KinA sporulation pathway (predicted exonuclease)
MDKYFFALDLEMNQAENSAHTGKIIQVGLAIGNLEQNIKEYELFDWYVDPNEKIYPRITELTGITNQDIQEKSTHLENIYNKINERIYHYNCYPNPVVWGAGDTSLLKQTFLDQLGYCKMFGHRDIDVKTLHTFFQLSKDKPTSSSLKSALSNIKIKFEGEPHRAHHDAANTLFLFSELVKRQRITNKIFEEAARLV